VKNRYIQLSKNKFYNNNKVKNRYNLKIHIPKNFDKNPIFLKKYLLCTTNIQQTTLEMILPK
jgi:hypothetical protein